MSNSDASDDQKTAAAEDGGAGNDESIKAAVREATKKTQERLAAYQKKQAEKQAAAAAIAENKTISKEAQQAESTVTRLQALVGESRRLTAKSKDLNATASAIKKSASATGPLTEASANTNSTAMQGLHRSMSCSAESAGGNGGGGGGSGNKKMKNLGDLLNSLGNSKLGGSFSNLSYTGPDSSKEPGYKRRATICDSASVGGGGGTSGGGAKGKKLGELFKNLGTTDPKTPVGSALPGLQRSATMNDASSSGKTPTAHHTPGGSLEKGKKLGAIFKSLNGSKSDLSGSISKLALGLGDEDVQKLKPLVKTKVTQSTLTQEEDESTSQSEEDGELGKNEGITTSGSGEYSIFNLVDDNARKTVKAPGTDGLRPDEVQDLVDDYHNESAQASSKESVEDMDASLPLLEAILETPKTERPKVKVGNSAKKKKAGKTTDDINVKRDKSSKKHIKMLGKSLGEISYSSNNDDEKEEQEDLDGSMPMLAPFETPQGAKPKLLAATTKSALKGPKNMEESLNLSQIMRQTDMLVPDNAGSRTNNKDDNDDSGQGSAGSHASKNGLRRPSRRKSMGRDDDKASKSKNSKKKSSRRSSLSKNNSDHKKNEEIANRAINKYHRTAGQGSSTMDGLEVCEKTGEVLKPELDVSAISEESSEGDNSLQDNSGSSHSRKSLGGSAHSRKSTRSTSAQRRGRTAGADSGSRRGVSRSVSRSSRRRGASRSVSRSASMRRNPRPRRSGGQGGIEGNRSFKEKRASLDYGDKSDDNNGSLRGDRMSMSCREVGASDRRARLRASARDSSMRDSSMRDGRRRRPSVSARRTSSRRNQRRDDDDNDSIADMSESQQSTAEDILNSLDVSEIKIVGEDEGKKSKMDASESGRTSIYDKPKPKQKRNSLAGLDNLESTAPAKPEGDDCDNSISDSIASSTSTAKKSKVGKFARSVGRRLTLKGKKKKKGSEDDEDQSDDSDEEEEEEEEEVDLESLAAEYDEEEKDIYEKSGSLHGSFRKGDFSQAEALDDLQDESEGGKKKKARGSVFGKIKKMGKIGGKKKDKKKKDKKGKGSERLDSDSESSEDELLGSGYSGGTPDKSQSDHESDSEDEEEDFVQLQIDGERASVVNGSERTDDPVLITPKSRQRRVSAVSGGRRQRGSINQQQRSALQAALEAGPRTPLRGDESSVGMSTNPNVRNRRARSLRGKIVRKGEGGVVPPRCKSLKDVPSKLERGAGRKIRRIKSVDFEGEMSSSKMDYDDEESPAFDWTAYSEKKETPPAREGAGPGPGRRARRGEGRRRSHQVPDKRMSGGLSKIIYASQTVTS